MRVFSFPAPAFSIFRSVKIRTAFFVYPFHFDLLRCAFNALRLILQFCYYHAGDSPAMLLDYCS